jgi:hypothetical protein
MVVDTTTIFPSLCLRVAMRLEWVDRARGPRYANTRWMRFIVRLSVARVPSVRCSSESTAHLRAIHKIAYDCYACVRSVSITVLHSVHYRDS